MKALLAVAIFAFSLHVAVGTDERQGSANIEADLKADDSPEYKALLSALANASDTGNWQGALNAAQAVVAKYPEWAYAYSSLGSVYENLGFADDAVLAYQKSIKLDSNSAGSWASLGAIYATKGSDIQSIHAYQQAVFLYRQSVEKATPGFSKSSALLDLGKLYKKIRRNDEARLTIAAAVQEKPAHPWAWIAFGDMLADDGKEEQAIAAYHNCGGEKFGLSRAWESLTGHYLDVGKNADAVRCSKKANELKAQGN